MAVSRVPLDTARITSRVVSRGTLDTVDVGGMFCVRCQGGGRRCGGMMARMWIKKWWAIVFLVVLALYVALVIYRVFAIGAEEKTAKAVEWIHGQSITMDDVIGKNLPPEPDQIEADATIEGIDANENGIRDDVELAIFEKYPNSARIRAAMLQYAMALQTELTKVSNSETLVAVIQEEDRGYFCVGDVLSKNLLDSESGRIEGLVMNTESRTQKHKELFRKYMVSYGDVKGKQHCDIEPDTLL